MFRFVGLFFLGMSLAYIVLMLLLLIGVAVPHF